MLETEAAVEAVETLKAQQKAKTRLELLATSRACSKPRLC